MVDNSENKDWKKYVREGLIPSFDENITEFDKTFLLIAGGIFTFSITFIKDIVHFDTAILICILFWGWILLGLSIGLILYTLFGTAYQAENIINEIDKALTKQLTEQDSSDLKDTINTQRKTTTKINKVLRFSSIILFTAGILLVSIFLYKNLTKPTDHKINIKTTTNTMEKTVIVDSNNKRSKTIIIDSNGKIEKTIIVDSSNTQK